MLTGAVGTSVSVRLLYCTMSYLFWRIQQYTHCIVDSHNVDKFCTLSSGLIPVCPDQCTKHFCWLMTTILGIITICMKLAHPCMDAWIQHNHSNGYDNHSWSACIAVSMAVRSMRI